MRSNIFAPAAAEGGGEREGGPYSSGGLGDTFESQNQLVSMQPQDYLQQRADDVEQVESTIRELGGIFGQLANIVAEQDEMGARHSWTLSLTDLESHLRRRVALVLLHPLAVYSMYLDVRTM